MNLALYPQKNIIYALAQTQLIVDANDVEMHIGVNYCYGDIVAAVIRPHPDGVKCPYDESLLLEILDNTLTPEKYPEIMKEQGTAREARRIEAEAIAEVLAVYRDIKRKQEDPTIIRLNKLLRD